jgi:NADH dehydrogenase (ubiquinone) 1 alpha subcomplex subunit 9
MALPLRCARARAAMPAQLRSARLSPFSTTASRPAAAARINHDVRITRCARCCF